MARWYCNVISIANQLKHPVRLKSTLHQWLIGNESHSYVNSARVLKTLSNKCFRYISVLAFNSNTHDFSNCKVGFFVSCNMKSRNGKNSMSHYTFWNPLLNQFKIEQHFVVHWLASLQISQFLYMAELWYFAPQKDVFSDRKVSTALSGIQEADRHAESALWMIFLSPLDTQLQCQHLRHRCHRGNQNILQFSSSCSSLSLVNGGSLRPKGQSSSSLAPDTLMMAARLSTPKSTSSNPI